MAAIPMSFIRENESLAHTDSINYLKTYNEGQTRKYHIVTYGCQMNVHDSEKIAGILENVGYVKTEAKKTADIIIFNTCCVRDHAEQRVYGNIGLLREQKLKNPNLIIAVCGCMMQQKDTAEYLMKKFPLVDIIFGTNNINSFPKLLYEAINSKHTVSEIEEIYDESNQGFVAKRNSRVSAWVTIMNGCDNYCSYCIVPYVRGREKSRNQFEIISEVKKLVQEGYKEVFLLGQNVNSYKGDKGYLFHHLIQDLNEVEGLERIRFISSHPKDFSDEFLNTFEKCDKLCEHVHLPAQSGSDKILESMNRKYSISQYRDLIQKIRMSSKKISITTDFIVGFPGETDKDFDDTLAFISDVRFDSAFTFMFSPRKGTAAANFPLQISNQVKKLRLDKLNKLQAEISKQINNNYVDIICEVMVEGQSKNDNRMLTGRTRENKIVNFEGKAYNLGQIVNIKITHAKAWTLEGVVN